MSWISILSILQTLTEVRWDKLKALWQLLLRWYKRDVLYEVLDNRIELDLVDTKGKVAHYRKQKQVRFLQNNIFAYLDTLWGDGDICVNYQCSPGKAVDFFEEGYSYRMLISLREIKQRGDEEIFHIQRTIHNGYLGNEGYLQTDITYPTKGLQVVIRFPSGRHPKHVRLMEKNTKQTLQVNSDHIENLPDGRYQIIWNKKYPRLHESYILSWKW